MTEKQLSKTISSVDLELSDGVTASVVIGGIQEISLKKDGKTLTLSQDEISDEVKESIWNLLDGKVLKNDGSDYLTQLMTEKYSELSDAEDNLMATLRMYFSVKTGPVGVYDSRNVAYPAYIFFADSINELEGMFSILIDGIRSTLKYISVDGMPIGSGDMICEIRIPPTLEIISGEKKYKLRFRASFYKA